MGPDVGESLGVVELLDEPLDGLGDGEGEVGVGEPLGDPLVGDGEPLGDPLADPERVLQVGDDETDDVPPWLIGPPAP